MAEQQMVKISMVNATSKVGRATKDLMLQTSLNQPTKVCQERQTQANLCGHTHWQMHQQILGQPRRQIYLKSQGPNTEGNISPSLHLFPYNK